MSQQLSMIIFEYFLLNRDFKASKFVRDFLTTILGNLRKRDTIKGINNNTVNHLTE